MAEARSRAAWQHTAAVLALLLFALCFGALALAIGAATGRRALAIGLSATLAVAADVINALNNATGTMSDHFSDWGNWSQGSNFVYVDASPGDEISDGPTSILPSLNMNAGPYTLGPSADKLSLWGATAVTQQTITGALSTVVDPAAKAVLTSLLAALSATAGYGLVIDGTT